MKRHLFVALMGCAMVVLAGGKSDAGHIVPRVDPTGKACSWSKPADAIHCDVPGEVPVCIIDKYDGKTESGGWGCAKPEKK